MNEEFDHEEVYGGEYFTLNDWRVAKAQGYITPDDGSGRWCFLSPNKELELQGGVFENDVFREDPPSWANGVMWYNK